MEAHEIAEQIHEHAEPHAHAPPTHDWFRRITAIYVGVVAMLLAISALGGAEEEGLAVGLAADGLGPGSSRKARTASDAT